MTDTTGPKIAPLTDATATDRQIELLAPLGPAGEMHIFRTIAVHPKLFRSWLPLGGRLLQGSTLTPRVREIVILATAARCGSDYEWGQHVGIAREAGLTDDEIRACARPEDADGWTAEDRAALDAAGQLVADHRITDATWEALVAAGWTDQQLIELTFLAGHYAMLAGMLRSVGVVTETPLPAVGATQAAP